MSSQTVVDVVISGTTATVVDAQVDGITTVAGAPQITNVSGQIPDLGVTTSYLAGQGEILSLTNDIANLRANVIITGQTLTDEIGVLSGVLISTGNYLESNILTLSGELIASGNNLDELRGILSGNLIITGQTLQTQITSNVSDLSTLTANLLTTGQTLSDEKFDKSGGVLAGNILPNVTETFDIGSSSKKWNSLYVKDAHIDASTVFLGDGGAKIKIVSNRVQLEGNNSTQGAQFVGDTHVDAGTLFAQKAFGAQFKILNTNATNLYEFHLDDDGHLNISGNLTGAVKFADPVTIEGSLAVKANQTGVFATDVDLLALTSNVVTTGQTLQTQITSNDSDIATLDSTTVKLTTNQSIAGNKIFSDKVTINNLHVTGTEVIVDVENLAVKDNLIHINSGESGAGISRISGGITIDRGTEPSANILYNDANDRFELNFPLALEGNLAVTANQTGVYASAANLVTTGQTLQTQITSNDGDISTLTTNLATTGATLTSEVGIVSGLITDNDGDITALKTATGVLKTSTDANTSNLISTGSFLDSEIAIVSGLAAGSAIDELSGNLITTGQTLQVQITSNDSDISTLTSNLVTTGQTLTSEIATVSGIAEAHTDVTALSGKVDDISGNLIITGRTLTTDINTVSANLISTGAIIDDVSGNLITTGQTLQTQITSNDGDISTLTSNLITTGQTLTSEIIIVSGLTTGSASDPALSGKVDTLSGNLITTGQTLQTQITSNDGDISTLTTNLITTGQTLQTQITSNDTDISNLTSNVITTGQTLTSEIAIVSGIAESHTDVTALSGKVDDISGNLITTGQTLQTQITSNDGDITTLTSNLITTGQTLTSEIAIVSGIATGGSAEDFAALSGDLITTGQTLQTQITSNDSDISTLTSNLITTGQTLTTDINTVSTNLISTGAVVDDISGNLITTGQTLQTQITSNDSDISTLTSNLISTGSVVDDVSGNLITTGQTLTTSINTNSSNLITTGQTLTSEIAIVSGIAEAHTDVSALSGKVDDISGNLTTTGQTLTTNIDTVSTNLITSGQTLQTQINSNDSDITTLTSNLIATGVLVNTNTVGIATNVTNIATNASNLTLTGAIVDDISGNLITTGQTLTSEIAIVSGIATGGSAEDFAALSGNLITTGQTLQTQITSNDGDITSLTSNLITTGQTLTSEIGTVSGLITDNDAEITALLAATGELKTDTNRNASNLITTGQTLTININTVSTNLVSTGSIVDDISGNLITTGQTLQTQITSNDGDITNLTSNLITTGQTLTTEITTVSGLITDNDGDITALKAATGVLKTSTDNNTANLISTGTIVDDISGNLITSGQTLQTQITSNDSDISTLTTNVITTGQTLQTQITSNDGDISTLTSNLITTGQTLTSEIAIVSGIATGGSAQQFADLSGNLITTGQTLQTQITSNDSDISTLTSNLISTGSVVDDTSGNLITTGQTLQTQITSNDSDISTLTSNLVTTGQTLTTNVNTVASNLVSTGTVVDDISGNLITTGQTLQTQITSNDGDITSLTSNLITTGQTLQTQITSNDGDIATLDSTTVKVTTNQSVAGNKIFTDTVTINNLTVTGTEVIVDVENLAVRDNIIHINSGESGAGISNISGGITIDRGTDPAANILYNDANDRFELNFPLATEGNLVASAANLITTGQTLTTNINTVSTNLVSTGSVVDDISGNLITTGQTLQTQITANDTDIATNVSNISSLTTNLVTTGQTLQTQITSNDSDISTLTSNLSTTNSNLVTTGQTLTTNINTVSTNLVSTGSIVDDISGNLITTGQTLQTQITSNDTDITNLSSNLVTTGQTLTTNINTVATNLVTTGQTLTSEIITVSGLIPATVIDGGGTANKVPLWSDANTIGDSVISQSSSKIGIGTATPDSLLHISSTSPAFYIEDSNATSTHSITSMTGGTNFTVDTRQSDGTFVSTDYQISKDANGANYQRWFTQGTERMRIISDGKVGIGTNAPDGILHVANTTYIDAPTNTGNSSALIWRRLDKTIVGRIVSDTTNLRTQFWDNNSSVLTISNDKVGIGSENPAYKLDVRGDYIFVDDGKGIRFGGSSHQVTRETGNELRLKAANTTGFITFLTGGGTEYMRIAADGKVGIGTNAPSQLLHVWKAGILEPLFQSTTGRVGLQLSAGAVGDVSWILYSGYPAAGDFNIRESGVANHLVIKKTTGDATFSGKVGAGGVGLYPLQVHGASGYTLGVDHESSWVRAVAVNESGNTFKPFAIGGMNMELRTGSTQTSALTLAADNTATFSGVVTANAGINIDNINIDGTTIALSSGDLTIDVAGNISLDADGNNITLKDGGIDYGNFTKSSNDFVVQSTITNGDILFKGSDGGSAITALSLNMSEAGEATFNSDVFLKDNKNVRWGDGQDFRISFDGSNAIIYNAAANSDVYFKGNNGSQFTALTLDMSDAGTAIFNHDITLPDSGRAVFGGGNDLKIYHDGSNSYITDSGTGELKLLSSGLAIQSANGNEYLAYFAGTGGQTVSLYAGNSKKFETTSTGVSVTGQLDLSSHLDMPDNAWIKLGASDDLLITHDGSSSWIIDNGAGGLVIASDSFYIKNAAYNETGLSFIENGAVSLYYDNAVKLATTSTGIAVTGNTTFADNGKAIFGGGNDLQIYHNLNNSFIINNTGYLAIKNEVTSGYTYIHGDTVQLRTYTGNETLLSAAANGAVTLYYDNAVKLATTSTGIDVTGSGTFSGALTGTTATFVEAGTGNGMGGVIAATASSGGNAGYRFQTGGSGRWQITTIGSSGSESLRFYDINNSVERFRITDGGNVGIGTSSPGAKLHVNGVSYFTGGDVAIGTTTPSSNYSRQLHVHATGTGASLHLTDSTSGLANGDGFELISHAGNAYVWQRESNSLIFGTAANEKMRITSAGNVGIGIASPTAMLDVRRGDTSGKVAEFHQSDGYGIDIGSSQAEAYISAGYLQSLIIKTNPGSGQVEQMRIDKDGKVGIGMTPTTKLSVKSTGSNVDEISLVHSGNTVKLVSLGQESSHGSIYVRANSGVAQARISAVNSNYFLQNVGIGTTAPGRNLHIKGALAANNTVAAKVENTGTGFAGVDLATDGTDWSILAWGSGTATPNQLSFYNGSTHPLAILSDGTLNLISAKFKINGSAGSSGQTLTTDGSGNISWSSAGSGTISGSGTDNYVPRWNGTTALQNSALFSDDNGNIGIGCTDPAYTFEVRKTVDTDWVSRIYNTSTNANSYGLLVRSANAASTTTHFGVYNGTAHTFAIKGDGKVGIGITAPGSVQLDVRSTTVSGGSFDVQDSYTNITSGASSLWLSNSNQTAGNYTRINFADAVGGSSTALIAAKCTDHTNNYGDLQFWTRGSGYGIRMHIDQEGNVGIGTTAPAAKLHVDGTTILGDISSNDWGANHAIGLSSSNGLLMSEAGQANNTNRLFLFYNDSGSPRFLMYQGNTTEKVRINSNGTSHFSGGSVGIGIAAPLDLLHLAAGGKMRIAKSGDASRYTQSEYAGVNTNANDGYSIKLGGTTKYKFINDRLGIGSTSPAAPLDVPRASDYKVIKLGDDITSHYVMTGNSDHTLTLTCGSYYQAEIVITANQTNGGTYNNLYIRGIWSNNHTSHHWDEIENVGNLSSSTFTITNGQNGATTNSGEWKIVHDYVSGSFAGMTVRITDFYGTHAYTIS